MPRTFQDLAGYVRSYKAGGYAVARVNELVCAQRPSASWSTTRRAAPRCSAIADSADYLDDADLGECACPCGGEEFAVAVGFALRADKEVRWISVGLRCLTDDTLGVYTDWKIDYGPTAHLLIPQGHAEPA